MTHCITYSEALSITHCSVGQLLTSLDGRQVSLEPAQPVDIDVCHHNQIYSIPEDLPKPKACQGPEKYRILLLYVPDHSGRSKRICTLCFSPGQVPRQRPPLVFGIFTITDPARTSFWFCNLRTRRVIAIELCRLGAHMRTAALRGQQHHLAAIHQLTASEEDTSASSQHQSCPLPPTTEAEGRNPRQHRAAEEGVALLCRSTQKRARSVEL